MSDVRAITVKQPWAWAIAHGGKNIENRSRPVAYRGPLLIHAGVAWSSRGETDERIAAVWGPHLGLAMPCHPMRYPDLLPGGVVVAAADLVDVHLQTPDCLTDPDRCNPWGEQSYVRRVAGRTRIVLDVFHYVLDDIRPLPTPVLATGRLGLWRPDTDVLARVAAQLEAAP